MADANSVYIMSACRTPLGSMSGAFRTVPAHELGSIVIKEALNRASIDAKSVSEVIMGQCLTAGQGQNPARLASLKAGLPVTVPAFGINMLCGSGLKAAYLGYQAIKAGEATTVVVGGQENMSMAPHCSLIRPGVKLGSTTLQDTLVTDGLTDPNIKMHMGDTAEFLAQKYKVSREKQDQFAYSSQFKTNIAMENGYFKKEIVPVTVKAGRKETVVEEDEYPRRGITMENLAKLNPVFAGGAERTVTAGNSSGINDGAAALVLSKGGTSLKTTPLARIVAFGQTGLELAEMGLGPVGAVKAVLNKAGWSLDDVDLFELNEAFAVQSVLVIEQLGVPAEKVNVAGGAISLGHPIGCSGARVLVTLLHNMQRLNKSKGIAALCIGGGMGIAIAVEKC